MLARIVDFAVTPRPAPSSDVPRQIVAKGAHSSFMIRANIYI